MDHPLLADFITSVFNEVPRLPPPMSPVRLGNSSATNTGDVTDPPTTSLIIPKPGGWVAGCLMVATGAFENTSGLSITPPAGWTQIDSVLRGILLRAYWKIADSGDPSSYTWTLSTARRAMGGILAFRNFDPSNPIFDSETADSHATSQSCPQITSVPEKSYLMFSTAVDADEGINADGNTLSMTAEWEARGGRNHKVWSQDFPAGGNTGTRAWDISTSIAQDMVSMLIAIRPG